MFLLLMGPPGAGKGTQAELLVRNLSIPHISTGDMFRAAVKDKTELGKEAQKYMDAGELVPDVVTIGIVKAGLSKPACKNGFILDGFPRTIEQAKALDQTLEDMGIQLTRVINITVPAEELITRITGRRICRSCGATYHVEYNKPAVAGICGRCSGELYQRNDDQEVTVKNRLEVYKAQTEPLIQYYQHNGIYSEIDGRQEIDKVYSDVMSSIRSQQA